VKAQMTAFKDTWLWDTGAQKAFDAVQEVPQSDLREPYSATAALLEKMALEQPQL
jgi:hypothetical protein